MAAPLPARRRRRRAARHNRPRALRRNLADGVDGGQGRPAAAQAWRRVPPHQKAAATAAAVPGRAGGGATPSLCGQLRGSAMCTARDGWRDFGQCAPHGDLVVSPPRGRYPQNSFTTQFANEHVRNARQLVRCVFVVVGWQLVSPQVPAPLQIGSNNAGKNRDARTRPEIRRAHISCSEQERLPAAALQPPACSPAQRDRLVRRARPSRVHFWYASSSPVARLLGACGISVSPFTNSSASPTRKSAGRASARS